MDQNMRILIVEDHPEVARWLQGELRHFGWHSDVSGTIQLARTMVRHQFYHVVLLDIMLPDGNGIDLCRQLRAFTKAAIIMVTAKDELSDRIRALEDGADDYLIKPFAVDELQARIRAVLRRTYGERGPVLEFHDLRLWPEERCAEQGGKPLNLSRREFELLLVFMQNPHRALTRDQLLEKAWGYDFYGESNVVDVTVRRLRDHLALDSRVSIATLRGVGYMLKTTHD